MCPVGPNLPERFNIVNFYQAVAGFSGFPLIPNLQIAGNLGPTPPLWGNVASIGPIVGLQAGDRLLVGIDLSVTQPNNYVTGVTTQVIAYTSVVPAIPAGGTSPGFYAIRAAGTNVDNSTIHHLLLPRTALYTVGALGAGDETNNYLTFMLNTQSTAAGANDFLTIDSFSGQCLIWCAHYPKR